MYYYGMFHTSDRINNKLDENRMVVNQSAGGHKPVNTVLLGRKKNHQKKYSPRVYFICGRVCGRGGVSVGVGLLLSHSIYC